ncbi:hypothetical protein UK23_14245 [Lentzea aerocolonigenes]|uniref:Uncharacterized protein n=1 Tax=Lentzea aerocolonigenes TaxID=68170 RepID=A0A0F0H3B0_LENAE|nr:hypothetical protein UK23_14245 [Lentzea aerocolonigenes]
MRSAGLLDVVRDNARLKELLAVSFEFDVARTESEGAAAIDCGLSLQLLAGDPAGGRFYLCGETGLEGPILYASSEGQAGLIADSLREALELVVGLPYWRDCLTYAGGGRLDVMADAMRHLQAEHDNSALPSLQAQVSELLCVDLPAPEIPLARLHAAGLRSEPGFVFRDETGEYEGLFGSFHPDRNPRWSRG